MNKITFDAYLSFRYRVLIKFMMRFSCLGIILRYHKNSHLNLLSYVMIRNFFVLKKKTHGSNNGLKLVCVRHFATWYLKNMEKSLLSVLRLQLYCNISKNLLALLKSYKIKPKIYEMSINLKVKA